MKVQFEELKFVCSVEQQSYQNILDELTPPPPIRTAHLMMKAY
jgi:hypothetical protein